MSEKTWSSIASPDAEQKRVQAIGALFADIDAGLGASLPTTPDEFLRISQEAQVEIEGPLKEVIEQTTNVLAKADQETPPSEEAPKDFEYIVLSKERARELDNAKIRHEHKMNPWVVANGTLEERYQHRGSSSNALARKGWERQFGQELIETDVIVFDIKDVIDLENSFSSTMTALPVIKGSPGETLKLVGAVRGAFKRLNDLTKNAEVIDFIETSDFSAVNFARNRDQAKTAPIQMFAEAIATTAEATALALADVGDDVDVGFAICELAKKNFFAKLALGLSMGFIGPLAHAGFVPKGGLVKKDDEGLLTLDPDFAATISGNAKENKQHVNSVMGLYALYRHMHPEAFWDSRPESEGRRRDRFALSPDHHKLIAASDENSLPNVYNNHASRSAFDYGYGKNGFDYFEGEGCPAVFFVNDTGVSPIGLTSKWVLKPYMPRRAK